MERNLRHAALIKKRCASMAVKYKYQQIVSPLQLRQEVFIINRAAWIYKRLVVDVEGLGEVNISIDSKKGVLADARASFYWLVRKDLVAIFPEGGRYFRHTIARVVDKDPVTIRHGIQNCENYLIKEQGIFLTISKLYYDEANNYTRDL